MPLTRIGEDGFLTGFMYFEENQNMCFNHVKFDMFEIHSLRYQGSS